MRQTFGHLRLREAFRISSTPAHRTLKHSTGSKLSIKTKARCLPRWRAGNAKLSSARRGSIRRPGALYPRQPRQRGCGQGLSAAPQAAAGTATAGHSLQSPVSISGDASAPLGSRCQHDEKEAARHPATAAGCRAWLVLPHPGVPWMRVFDASTVKAKGRSDAGRLTHFGQQKRADLLF